MPSRFQPDEVGDVLTDLAQHLPGGGETREGQVTMATRVAQAIADGQHLIARAGTGTGKSLAYLLPAVLSGRRTVIATATKALQDQLAGKDLPFLAKHHPVEFAVLKGRSNYLCVQRAKELADDRQLALDGISGDRLDEELDTLAAWAETTPTGDRAELEEEPSHQAWAAVSVAPGECPGAGKCPSGQECYAEFARAGAQEADIVVVNTHLYGLHLAAEGGILPEHDLVVIDEAHQLEDVISATAGIEIGPGRFRDLARRVNAILIDEALVDRLSECGEALDAALGERRDVRVTLSDTDDLGQALQRGRNAVDRVMGALRKIPDDLDVDTKARKDRAMQSATSLVTELDAVWNIGDGDVAWVGGPPRSLYLRVAPIDVGATLRDSLWNQHTVVLTSATVPEVLPGQLGLSDGQYEFIDVGSPFDYESSALLYCAADLPDPRAADHAERRLTVLERLIVAAGGRTLALFTSWRAMNEAVEELRPRLPWEIHAQGERPKLALLEAFTADPESCLFATMSFWQGVDVQGQALSLVAIDRIPFPRPDDPLLDARRDRAGSAAFRTVDLPRAATMLAQGTGRLIRSTTDRGVVAVLDPRLAKAKSYRWDLIAALPPYPRTADLEEAEDFLRLLRDA